MAKKHTPVSLKDRDYNPEAPYTAAGFKVTVHTGPRTERLSETIGRTVEYPGRGYSRSDRLANKARLRALQSQGVLAARKSGEMNPPEIQSYYNEVYREQKLRLKANPNLALRIEQRLERKLSQMESEQAARRADPKQRVLNAERNEYLIRRASRDTGITSVINPLGHEVKTPDGLYMYHRDRQKAALEIAKSSTGSMRKMALSLAKEHGQDKRKYIGGGAGRTKNQPRVPAGSPDGGQWTNK
jgi:hypothetical protein